MGVLGRLRTSILDSRHARDHQQSLPKLHDDRVMRLLDCCSTPLACLATGLAGTPGACPAHNRLTEHYSSARSDLCRTDQRRVTAWRSRQHRGGGAPPSTELPTIPAILPLDLTTTSLRSILVSASICAQSSQTNPQFCRIRQSKPRLPRGDWRTAPTRSWPGSPASARSRSRSVPARRARRGSPPAPAPGAARSDRRPASGAAGSG